MIRWSIAFPVPSVYTDYGEFSLSCNGKEGAKLKRAKSIIISLLLAAWTVSTASADYVIRIGAILSLTGPGSFQGEQAKNTLTMIQDQVNSRGGILGKELEVIIFDDETDVNMCLLGADKLIEMGDIAAVIGPTTSGNTLAISHTFETAKIPLLSLAPSEKIVKPVKKWVFKTPPSDRFAVAALLKRVKSKRIRKIALITGLNGFGQAGRAALKELLPTMGLILVADEVFSPEDTDMTKQLSNILETEAGVDGIICWGDAPGTAAVVRNIAHLEIEIPLYASHGAASSKFIKLAGKASEGIILPAERLFVADTIPGDHPQKDLLLPFIKDYETRFGTTVSNTGSHTRDALMLILRAMEMGESDNPGDIRDNLEKISGFVGTGGIFNFSPWEHNGVDDGSFETLQIKRGAFKIVR